MAQANESAPPKRYRHGIRYQIASLLLLSTLNGVVLLTATIFLFSSIRFQSADTVLELRAVFDSIEDVHKGMIQLVSAEEKYQLVTLEAELTKLNQQLDEIGPSTANAQAKLQAFGKRSSDWHNYILARLSSNGPPIETQLSKDKGEPSPGENTEKPTEVDSIEGNVPSLFGWLDDRGEVLFFQMEESQRALLAELALIADTNRPQWIDKAMQWGPWMMAWVLMVSLMTLLMAFRVKTVLSTPLEKLISVTSEVSKGNLSVEIPELAPWRGAPEILALSRSVATMRNRLVQSIGESERRRDEIVTVLNSLKDGVMVLDSKDCIIDLNPQAAGMMMQRLEGEVPRTGQAFDAIFPSLDSELVDTDQELSFPTHSDKIRHLTIRVVNMRNRRLSSAGARIIVIRDITQDHEVEELKREFLSVITHELKTPLTAIEGYNKLLLLGKGGGLSDKQKKFASIIADQTSSLKTMIQNLLDATRLEGNNLPLELRVVSANQLMEECAQSFQAAAQTKGLRLNTKLNLENSTQFSIDPFRFKQVVGNLISNALKFTPEGGSINLISAQDGELLTFTVQDTGRGIPEESLAHLFDKFYQVAKGDTRIQGGAGLGLYICRQLVESQGGHISVHSTLGEGSAFTLRFKAQSSPGA